MSSIDSCNDRECRHDLLLTCLRPTTTGHVHCKAGEQRVSLALLAYSVSSSRSSYNVPRLPHICIPPWRLVRIEASAARSSYRP